MRSVLRGDKGGIIMDGFSGIIGLVGVCLGGLITFKTTYYFENQKISNEKKSIAAALLGEIKALKSLADTRGYISLVEDTISEMKKEKQVANFEIPIRNNYTQVFDSFLDKCGILPSLTVEKLILFYSNFKSVNEDFITISQPDFLNSDFTEALSFMNNLHTLMVETYAIAKELEKELSDIRL